MAEVIPTNRFITALGPIKLEVLSIAGTVVVADSATGNPSSVTQTGVDDTDTVKTLIQNPLFTMGAIVSDDVTITRSFNATIGTSPDEKTLTINSADLAADDIVILVFGF